MLEKNVEQHLVKCCKKIGAYTRKFVSPSQRGVPDRIVVYKGVVYFVELKVTGGKATKLQQHEIDTLRNHGATAKVVCGKEGVDRFIENIVNFQAALDAL